MKPYDLTERRTKNGSKDFRDDENNCLNVLIT